MCKGDFSGTGTTLFLSTLNNTKQAFMSLVIPPYSMYSMSSSLQPSVLLVEDSVSLAAIYQGYLAKENLQLIHKETGAEAMDYLKNHAPNLILLDLNLPDVNGMTILKHLHAIGAPCSVVIITAHGSVDVAVDAMRYGAFDFIEKPFNGKRLRITVRNALEWQNLCNKVDIYREQFDRDHYEGFIGSSLAMQSIYSLIDNVANSKSTVFITGSSGTGKEICAEALHNRSARREQPFIAINCAAIPKELMESEIFGHVKGAFTGATSGRQGLAAQANHGSLFFDEICEMPIDLQSKLLRFFQTGSFCRVGSNQLEQVNVRFICATNRDPWAEVQAGHFREDLYYRLHVIPIVLPDLHARDNDVVMIARYFLLKYAREENKAFTHFSRAVEIALVSYSWPGNVRQLLNIIRHIVVLHHGEEVTIEMLPPPLNAISANAELPAASDKQALTALNEQSAIQPLWLTEKQAIEKAIALFDGNIPKAAIFLEISPSTIYRKLQTWGNYTPTGQICGK